MIIQPPPVPRPRRCGVPIAAALSVLVLLGAAVAARRLDLLSASDGAGALADPVLAAIGASSPGACTVPPPLTEKQLRRLAPRARIPPTALPAGAPARAPLGRLATAITTSGCDNQTGRYAYVQHRQWVIDHPHTGTALLQYENWLADDRSGRSTTTSTRTPAAEERPTDDTWTPGKAPELPVAWSTDPGRLAEQLGEHHSSAPGDAALAVLSALADLNHAHTPGRDVRAAALRVLAGTDGLTYHGAVTDRAGRHGIAVAASSSDGITRKLLIIDPRTGDLLAAERTALRDPGALGITEPTVLTYQLFLARTRTGAPDRPVTAAAVRP